MGFWKVIVLFFLLMALFKDATSQKYVVVSDERLEDISLFLEVYIDSTRQITPQELLHKYRNQKFVKRRGEVHNLTGVDGDIWCRFEIENHSNEQLYVHLNARLVNEATLYQISHDSLEFISHERVMPLESRHFFPFTQIALPTSGSSKQVFFLRFRMQGNPPLFVLVKVGTLKHVIHFIRVLEFLSVAVLGMMFVMLFYNLCLAIVIGDLLYVKYSLYISSSIFCIAWLTGFGAEWFWPNRPDLNPVYWPMGLFNFTQLLFVNSLLQVKQKMPVASRASLLIYSMNAIIMIPGISPGVGVFVIFGAGFLIPVYFLIVSAFLLQKRDRMAMIFLLGWIPLLTITVLNAMMSIGLIDYNIALDLPAVEISLCWELVIFSLALGYRYNIIKKEKLDMQNENIRIINEQKALLRRMVFEQTEEMMAQNDQLLKSQEEIKLQNERLEAQNKAYERLKEMILQQNHQLEAAVQKRTLQLAQSNDELKKHFHQLEQFSFIAAHNLRAPVARILGLASIFDISDISNPENKIVLEKIVVSAQDLDLIIHDLGSILDAQKNNMDKAEPINLPVMVHKILLRFENEIERHGIRVDIQMRANSVIAIPAYVDSIITNLVSNSIKYRSEILSPEIIIRIYEDDTKVVLEVEDNGLGFDSKLFSNKLFEPFQRFHTHGNGKGLGMFLVKTQVTAMKGTIDLTSEPNKGTKVTISIPKPHVLEFFAG